MIQYGKQDITEDDIESVIGVLRSDYLTQGPMVPKFEYEIANYTGSNYAVATCNATAALHVACLALGVGKGDRVWTSATSFVASANCALYCGATVDFVDIDPDTYNMSTEVLELKLSEAEKEGVLPKVVIPVHLAGQSCDMERVGYLSKKYGFRVIEDASHAVGGEYKGKKVGGCQYSDIAVFSFHPVKIITTAEGGMAVTNDVVLHGKMKQFRSHGITSSADEMYGMPDNEIWNYQQVALGHNYRLTDVHAALGISQMKRLDSFVEKRHEIASKYDEMLSECGYKLPFQSPQSRSSYHLYPIRVEDVGEVGRQRRVYDHCMSEGINVNLHYIPIYRHPYFQKLGFERGYCPEAEAYFREAISIPLHPKLSEDDVNRVVSVLEAAAK